MKIIQGNCAKIIFLKKTDFEFREFENPYLDKNLFKFNDIQRNCAVPNLDLDSEALKNLLNTKHPQN